MIFVEMGSGRQHDKNSWTDTVYERIVIPSNTVRQLALTGIVSEVDKKIFV